MPRLSEQDRDEICLLYEQGASTYTVAEAHGIAPVTVRRTLERRGIPRRPCWARACNLNMRHDCFAEVDDEESAYWLGFLYADGCITESKNRVDLVSKDQEHVAKFRDFVGGEQKIYQVRGTGFGLGATAYRYQVSSREIVHDLARWGCVPRKAAVIRMPDFLASELVRHFIRGFVDGDGCISYVTTRRVWQFYVCGNQLFLLELQRCLIKNCGLSQTKLQRYEDSPDLYRLVYGGSRQVRRVLGWLYQDAAVYLDRKKKIVVDCLGVIDFAA